VVGEEKRAEMAKTMIGTKKQKLEEESKQDSENTLA